MSIKNFTSWLLRSNYAPYSVSDIKDTMGESVLVRAKDDKKSSKSLYYSYTEENGRGFGHVYSCRDAVGDYWFSRSEKSWSEEERKEWEELRERKRAEAEAKKLELHTHVAKTCMDEYRISKLATRHPYLTAKGIETPSKVKHDDKGNLLFPAIDVDGKLWTLQRIDEDGEKRFVYGGKKEGTFFPFGMRKSVIPEKLFICEGVATGASIYEATNIPTLAAWDAGNLMAVTKAVRQKYPDTVIIHAADNDQWTIKTPRPKDLVGILSSDVAGDDARWGIWARDGKLYNKGQDAAGKAAMEINGYAVFPDFEPDHPEKPTDFNDMHRLMGLGAVKDRLLGVVHFPTSNEVVPVAVELDSPSLYAPAAGDDIQPRFYEPDSPLSHIEHQSVESSKPSVVEAVKLRSDGNPEWFTDMIWDKEPSGKLINEYLIKDLHDGKSMNNLITFIRGYLPKMFVLNEFSDEIIMTRQFPWIKKGDKEYNTFRVHRVNEADRINLSAYLEFFGFKVSDKTIEKAIISISEKDKQHPVKEYFDTLVWDGVPRLDTWLGDVFGSSQHESYLSSIGSKWLIAGAARVYNAGCQFSHMLVLEGQQDIGKSAVLRQLATFGDDIEESYFTDNISALGCNKPFAAMMWQGKLIIEFGELSGMDKADIETVKAWISRQEDEYQKKGSNDVLKKPRQFILSGTTNRRNWLNDSTGGKRFWPVACVKADIPLIKKIKKQLWAEAVHRYKLGEKYWLDDDDDAYRLAKMEQTVRINVDEWQDILEMSVSSMNVVRPREIYEWLHIDVGHLDNAKSIRIRTAMQALGFEYKQAYKVTGNKNRVWVRE